MVNQNLQDQTYDQLGFQNRGQPAHDAIVSYPLISNPDGGQQVPGLQGSMAPLDSNLFSYLAGNPSVPHQSTQRLTVGMFLGIATRTFLSKELVV